MKIENEFDEEEALQTIINKNEKKKSKEKRWRTKQFVSAEIITQQECQNFNNRWWRRYEKSERRSWI
jgi:2-oxoglutarate dehydrogenase complex dehydrogenase (E1) component-like enzyme